MALCLLKYLIMYSITVAACLRNILLAFIF